MTGDSLFPRLQALRCRLLAQAFAERLARSAIVVLSVALLLAASERGFAVTIPWERFVFVGTAMAVAWALIATAMRAPSPEQVAVLLDRLGATRDRWITALTFAAKPPEPGRELAARECAAYLASRDFRPLLPWKLPRALLWAVAPLAAIGFLQWQIRDERAAAAQEAALARQEAAPRIEQLKTLARAIDKAREENASAELERMAEQIKRSAESLRSEAADRTAASKAALRELSRLEQLIREMQQSPAQLSPEELDALAKALEQQDETAAAAEALKQGRTADAAKALEQAAKKLAETKDQPASQHTAEALREAMERLAQQREISEALREIARQLSQRTGQGSAGQMLQQLAQMLKQGRPGQAGQQQKKQAGQDPKATQQTLQKLLAALQMMKHGQPPGQPQDASAQRGDQDGQVLVQTFGRPDGAESLPGAMMAPSGAPGSENDSGTTENPFGSERSEIADKGGEMVLRGQLGEGESLSQLLPAAGGNDTSQRRYKEIYEAMAPAAEDALLQENIPLGSRFLIKRYFELIRP